MQLIFTSVITTMLGLCFITIWDLLIGTTKNLWSHGFLQKCSQWKSAKILRSTVIILTPRILTATKLDNTLFDMVVKEIPVMKFSILQPIWEECLLVLEGEGKEIKIPRSIIWPLKWWLIPVCRSKGHSLITCMRPSLLGFLGIMQLNIHRLNFSAELPITT